MTEQERLDALQAVADFEESGKYENPALTEVLSAGIFWMAEEYHQDYLEKMVPAEPVREK